MASGQSRKQSAIESVINIVVGTVLSFLLQLIVFPVVLGVRASFDQHVVIILIFTLASFARSYVLRRFFNKMSLKGEFSEDS